MLRSFDSDGPGSDENMQCMHAEKDVGKMRTRGYLNPTSTSTCGLHLMGQNVFGSEHGLTVQATVLPFIKKS